MNNMPNLFVIGAPKSGTTALANNLSEHPGVFMSKQKEPRYFDAHVFFDYEEDYPIKSLDEYLELFNSEEAENYRYRMDASVFNMYSKNSIDEIIKLSPDAKFIVVLRDPVSASVSMHKQRLKYAGGGMRELSEDFLECWSLLDARKNGEKFPKDCRNKFLFRYDLLFSYENYVPYLISTIKPENLFIGFYEDYKSSSSEFFKSIFRFLNVEIVALENKSYNESYIVKKSNLLVAIQYISKYTYSIRKKMGLTGGKLMFIKNFVYKFYKIQNGGKYDLSEVKKNFKTTYEYLESLKKMCCLSGKKA